MSTVIHIDLDMHFPIGSTAGKKLEEGKLLLGKFCDFEGKKHDFEGRNRERLKENLPCWRKILPCSQGNKFFSRPHREPQ